MTVYVDDSGIAATVGRHTSRWSHLTGDTQEELHEFAARLGLKRSYFQVHRDTPLCPDPARCPHWHYDVTATKREQALRLGAKPIDRRELAELIAARRAAMRAVKQQPAAPPPPVAGQARPDLDPVERDMCAMCGRPARLYPGGWRCGDHSPAAVRTILAGLREAPAAAPSAPASLAPGDAPKRKARWNATLQRHSWVKMREHHRRCDFCGIHVVNEHGGDHRTWWQTWIWRDGTTGTNKGEAGQRLPKCPGPATTEETS